jgi:broad specificity phosphatase PhoE
MRGIFVRHGETEQIVAGITQGQGVGGDLNDLGKWQAQQIALALKAEQIDHAYCSDLKRAVDTADAILQQHPDVPVQYTPVLRERSLGIYEGRPKREWKEANRAATVPFHLFKPIGGESYEEVRQRIYAFYKKLVALHPDETVLLVTHGGTLAMLYMTLLEKPLTPEEYEKYRPENTAVTIGEFDRDGTIRIEILNSTQHVIADLVDQI